MWDGLLVVISPYSSSPSALWGLLATLSSLSWLVRSHHYHQHQVHMQAQCFSLMAPPFVCSQLLITAGIRTPGFSSRPLNPHAVVSSYSLELLHLCALTLLRLDCRLHSSTADPLEPLLPPTPTLASASPLRSPLISLDSGPHPLKTAS